MEPEDNQSKFSQKSKPVIQFFTKSSDSCLRRVEEIQTSRRRRKRNMTDEKQEQHECSTSTAAASHGRSLSFISFSSSPLVVFLLSSALLLFLCATPSHSLPFDGRSLSSSSNGAGSSSSHISQMDLRIDPIYAAENGDDDPAESKRVVKSVFDMVLRTPPPPTGCPPGTQSPFEGGPCIKKSTDPVAYVDQSFLLDALRGLAKENGLIGGGAQKQRRPGNNRRRTSGRPGSRTTSTSTTPAPSTTMMSAEEVDEGSPTTTITSGGGSDTGDNIVVNTAEQDVITVTQEPSAATVETTRVEVEEETVQSDTVTNPAVVSSPATDQVSSDTITPDSTVEVGVSTSVTTTTVPTSTLATESAKNSDGDQRRTAEPETVVPTPSTTAGNGKKSSPSYSSYNSYISSFQFPFLSRSSVIPPAASKRQNDHDFGSRVQGQSDTYRYSTINENSNPVDNNISNAYSMFPPQSNQIDRRQNHNYNYSYNNYLYNNNNRRSRRRLMRRGS